MPRQKHPPDPSRPDHELTRRDFVALTLGGGLASAGRSAFGEQRSVTEAYVDVKTEDGVCDAAFFHPPDGSYPGVLIWHDSPGLRPAMRELGRRMAGEGYSVLVPNLFYRMAKAPVFDKSFDFALPADRERYGRIVSPFLAPGAAERDAAAYVAFLDSQRPVDRSRKVGTHGYCLGGPYAMKTAAARPDRVGAAASFHGGFLVTDRQDSPHLLAPRIRARMYFAIASDDDRREPQVKDKLREAFSQSKAQAEIEVYPNALHGWCVPDSRNSYSTADADRAWIKLLALYKTAL